MGRLLMLPLAATGVVEKLAREPRGREDFDAQAGGPRSVVHVLLPFRMSPRGMMAPSRTNTGTRASGADTAIRPSTPKRASFCARSRAIAPGEVDLSLAGASFQDGGDEELRAEEVFIGQIADGGVARIGEDERPHHGHARLCAIEERRAQIRDQIVLGPDLRDDDGVDSRREVEPRCPAGADQDLHHRRVGGELAPPSVELRRRLPVPSGIRPPHREVHEPTAQCLPDGFPETLPAVRVSVPHRGVLPALVVEIAREDEVVVSVAPSQALRGHLGEQHRVAILQVFGDLALLAAIDLEALDAGLEECLELVLEPGICAVVAHVDRPLGAHQISEGLAFRSELTVAPVGDPEHELEAGRSQALDHVRGIREAGAELQVPVAQSPPPEPLVGPRVRPVQPHRPRRDLALPELPGIAEHDVLRARRARPRDCGDPGGCRLSTRSGRAPSPEAFARGRTAHCTERGCDRRTGRG